MPSSDRPPNPRTAGTVPVRGWAEPLRALRAALAVVLLMSLVTAVLGVPTATRAETTSHPSASAAETSPGIGAVLGAGFSVLPADGPCVFEDDRLDGADGLSGAVPDGTREPVRDAAVTLHRTKPSQTSPKTGGARGPPVRTEHLFSGALRTHRIRPSAAGVDHPCHREDHADARTARPEDP